MRKASLAAAPLFALAVLAGAFISCGAIFSTTAVAGAAGVLPFGVTRVLAGVVFSLGLIAIVVGGAELFTGNVLLVMAWAAGRVSTGRVLRNWGIVLAGNCMGALATAVLAFLAGHHLGGSGSVGVAALSIAQAKSSLSFGEAFASGILCNGLVCLAVWLSYSARSTTDRVFAVVPPVAAFVAAGFEHSIANVYFLSSAALVSTLAGERFWAFADRTPSEFPGAVWATLPVNLVPVTLGNVVGGAVLVGAFYWFVFLRPKPATRG